MSRKQKALWLNSNGRHRAVGLAQYDNAYTKDAYYTTFISVLLRQLRAWRASFVLATTAHRWKVLKIIALKILVNSAFEFYRTCPSWNSKYRLFVRRRCTHFCVVTRSHCACAVLEPTVGLYLGLVDDNNNEH